MSPGRGHASQLRARVRTTHPIHIALSAASPQITHPAPRTLHTAGLRRAARGSRRAGRPDIGLGQEARARRGQRATHGQGGPAHSSIVGRLQELVGLKLDPKNIVVLKRKHKPRADVDQRHTLTSNLHGSNSRLGESGRRRTPTEKRLRTRYPFQGPGARSSGSSSFARSQNGEKCGLVDVQGAPRYTLLRCPTPHAPEVATYAS